MDTFVLGPLFARRPGMEVKSFPHETNGHTHNEDHLTAIWGPHRVTVDAPIMVGEEQAKDANGELLWYRESDKTYAGNGPDSLIFIAHNKRHNLIAQEAGCYHTCLFLHKDGEGKTTRQWQGYAEATY